MANTSAGVKHSTRYVTDPIRGPSIGEPCRPTRDQPSPTIAGDLCDLFRRVTVDHERFETKLLRHSRNQLLKQAFRARPAFNFDAVKKKICRQWTAQRLDDIREDQRFNACARRLAVST